MKTLRVVQKLISFAHVNFINTNIPLCYIVFTIISEYVPTSVYVVS